MTEVSPEDRERLLKAIDTFTSEIFDHVRYLGRVDMLHQVYAFRHDAEKAFAKMDAIAAITSKTDGGDDEQ